MVSSYHGLRLDLQAMRRRLDPSMKGVTLANVVSAAEQLRLAPRAVRVELDHIHELNLPAILHWDMCHFVVLAKSTRGRLIIHDPLYGRRLISTKDASRHFTGIALEVSPRPDFAKGDERETVRLRDFITFTRDHRVVLAEAIVISLFLEFIALSLPLLLQLVLDRVILNSEKSLLLVLAIGFVGIAIINAALLALRGWFSVAMSAWVGLQLFDNLFSRLLTLPLTWFKKRNIGDIYGRFRSVEVVQRTLTVTFLESVLDGVMVVVTLVVMLLYDFILTGVVLSAALVYAVTRLVLYPSQRALSDERLTVEGRASTHFLETLRGIQAIRLSNREPERRASYLALVTEQTNIDAKLQQSITLQRAVSSLIQWLENIAVVCIGALLVIDKALTVGMLFAFLALKQTASSRFISLLDRASEQRLLGLHLQRMGDIAATRVEPPEHVLGRTPLSTPLTICAESIAFGFSKDELLFQGVDFRVSEGEVVALVGPSGSGKSTLVRVLVGLYPASAGRVLINGTPIDSIDSSSFRRLVGAVAQDDVLFVGSLADNISFFDAEGDVQRIYECAELAEIHEEILGFPMRYETLVGSLAVPLSGGQRQRILLARALYAKPRILFVDESFDQLDLASEAKILENLRRLGIGLVLVSHRPESIGSVDRKIEILSRG